MLAYLHLARKGLDQVVKLVELYEKTDSKKPLGRLYILKAKQKKLKCR